jgi:hypothetical protein
MNEPAFPNEGFNGWGEPFKGMTLRDYFAAKAMQGFAAMDDVDGFSSVEEMAKMSYKWADAMMKVRQA